MGSFSMHIAISKKIKEKFSFGNEFMLGTVLPDLYKLLLENKDLTHFHIKVGDEYIPNIEKFCNDYKNKKSETVYGYLVHLVEDKVWFTRYGTKKYVKKLEDGIHYKYYKDNTIHNEEEVIEDIYTDYAIIDKYLIKKYSLDRKKINENFKKSILENKDIVEKEELINLVDTRIIDYSTQYDITRPITFLTEDEINDYFKEALLETERILTQFIEK